MKAVAQFPYPDDVKLSITITATVSEWKALRERLDPSRWPDWKFADAIRRVITDSVGSITATQEFEP